MNKCIICGNETDSFKCSDCNEKIKDGFIALIVADREKSKIKDSGRLTPENAYRTGSIVWIRETVLKRLYRDITIESVMFIDIGTEQSLKNIL